MARLGRGQPFAPHLAKPVLTGPAPRVSRAQITSAVAADRNFYQLWRGRVQYARPNLAPQPFVKRATIVSAVARNAVVHGLRGKVHFASPNLAQPPVIRPYIVSTARSAASAYSAPRKVNLPRFRFPDVAVPPLWTRAYVISSVRQNSERHRRGLLMHLGPPIVGPFVAAATVFGRLEFTVPNQRLEYTAVAQRLDFTTKNNRLEYKAQQ